MKNVSLPSAVSESAYVVRAILIFRRVLVALVLPAMKMLTSIKTVTIWNIVHWRKIKVILCRNIQPEVFAIESVPYGTPSSCVTAKQGERGQKCNKSFSTCTMQSLLCQLIYYNRLSSQYGSIGRFIITIHTDRSPCYCNRLPLFPNIPRINITTIDFFWYLSSDYIYST